MSWLDVKPTPYDELPDEIILPGYLGGGIRVPKEILYDWGWDVETQTTCLMRAINYRTEQLAMQIDDEMMK